MSNFVQMMEMEAPAENGKTELIFSDSTASENSPKEDFAVTDSDTSVSVGNEVSRELTSKPEAVSTNDIVHCDNENEKTELIFSGSTPSENSPKEDLAVTNSDTVFSVGNEMTVELTLKPVTVSTTDTVHCDDENGKTELIFSSSAFSENYPQEDVTVRDSDTSVFVGNEVSRELTSKPEAVSTTETVHCDDENGKTELIFSSSIVSENSPKENLAVTNSETVFSVGKKVSMELTLESDTVSTNNTVCCNDENGQTELIFSSSASESCPKEDLAVTGSDPGFVVGNKVSMELTLKLDTVGCNDVSPVVNNVQSMTNSRNPVQNTVSNMIWIYDELSNDGNGLSSSYDVSVTEGDMAEQVIIKGESHETNDSSNEKDLEESDQNLSFTGEQFSTSEDVTRKTSNFPDGFEDVIKIEDSYQQDDYGTENGSISEALGDPSVSEFEVSYNGTPKASPELEVSRKRKRKVPENGSPDLFAPREKRSAFKRCTEWFKVLSGEMHASHFCALCGASFSSGRELKAHKFIHDVKKTEPVEDEEKAPQPNNEVVERLEHKEGKSFECQECKECFSSKSGLTRHQTKHAGLSLHHCELCDQTFSTKAKLQAHIHSHTDNSENIRQKVTMLKTPVSRVRKFKCDKCDARFTQQWSLDQHLIIHTQSKTYFDCKECSEKFPDITLLVKHQESHSYQKLYQCSDCDERFSHKTNLYKHQLTHVNPRKAECSECGEMFAERSQLKIHLFSVHGTENVCVCSHCSKFFTKQSTLKRHLLTHSERESFKCPVCKETFAQKSTLTRHSILHAGEQFYRFVCSVCDRKFSRRETLNDHVRTHTGEKPFICEVCREGFSQKSAMKRHQILHFKDRGNKRSHIPRSIDMDTGATEDILLSLVYSDS